jgi:hypothetical protein
MPSDTSRDALWQEWDDLVNMTPAALSRWLETEESRSVGDTGGKGESTGHKSGRAIVEILTAGRDRLTDDQWDHVAKVVGYIKRHKAQGGPKEGAESSPWRHSLMNWGHDPLK